jgi:inosine-uridine nucleoside N-ribohydrolase
VDILALGPMTNLDAALQRDRQIFVSRVSTLYYLGTTPTHQPGQNPDGVFGAVYFPWGSINGGAGWEAFLDPIAASRVVSSGGAPLLAPISHY